jgi:hypothetical protein
MVMDLTLAFVREANSTDSEEKLTGLIAETAQALGFEQFTLGHQILSNRRYSYVLTNQ